MKNLLVLHGPNLNLLGLREPEVYGSLSLNEIDQRLKKLATILGFDVKTKQSNSEGELIDLLHQASEWADGVVFNPGGYTHTSVALRDAIASIGIPVVEVHLSNISAREKFRQNSLLAGVCAGSIMGFGWQSYALGLRAFVEILSED